MIDLGHLLPRLAEFPFHGESFLQLSLKFFLQARQRLLVARQALLQRVAPGHQLFYL